ncbi:MAG: RadC family protein [Methylocystaceae bacterium]
MEPVYRTIPELPPDLRPRERLKEHGAGALSNAELLAILLGSGTRSQTALGLAAELLSHNEGLRYLAISSLSELEQIKGVGLAKASRIKAALELGRRLALQSLDRPLVKSAEDVKNMVMDEMRIFDREHFRALYLDRKLKLIAMEEIAVGGLSSAVIHPREVFKPAVQRSAASIILIHNHPSGDPTPSAEDIELTRRLKEAGQIMGIDIIDHIVIGDNRYASLNNLGLLAVNK